jgi:hypothetical protein
MSMTKLIATAVALQLVEQGKLDLDAPVKRYCPDFGELQVLEGFDGDTPRLRPPASERRSGSLSPEPAMRMYQNFEAALYASL